jgi:hypothetical protein
MVRLPFDALWFRKGMFVNKSVLTPKVGICFVENCAYYLADESEWGADFQCYDFLWNVWFDRHTDRGTADAICTIEPYIHDVNLSRIMACTAFNTRPDGNQVELALRSLGYCLSGYKLIRNHVTGGIVVQRKAQDMSELGTISDVIKELAQVKP